MKVYLGSDGMPGLGDVLAGCSRVLLVPTAAASLEDRSHLAVDLARLEHLGHAPRRLDLDAAAPHQVRMALDWADAVFVTGGALSYLLHHALCSGFVDMAGERVRSGALIYGGLSAGAILAGPDAGPIIAHSPRPLRVDLASTRCMGLVDFIVLPHDGQPGAHSRNDGIIAAFDRSFEFRRLDDDHALLVDSEGTRLLEMTGPASRH